MHAQSRPLARPADTHAPVHAPDWKFKWPTYVVRNYQLVHCTLLMWHPGHYKYCFNWHYIKYADHAQ